MHQRRGHIQDFIQDKYVHYEFVVVPFDLTNDPTTFLCLINSFFPYLDKFFIVSIDDIFLYSKNDEKHVEHLTTVLRFLREHQLYANLRKNRLFWVEVNYLGHVVPKNGITVDSKKINAIME